MTRMGPAPRRPIGKFEPLITAKMGFPALERLAMGARRDLWLAFRVFDPTTKLRDQVNIGSTWLDLLRHRLHDGVNVRVMLADFDPIGAPELHEATWKSSALLKNLESEGSIEILPVRHEARLGLGLRFGFWFAAALELDRQRKQMNGMPASQSVAALGRRPGLWRYLRANNKGRIVWRSARLPRLFPATLHQKMAVADASIAVLGGLDIDERRYDDPKHQREAAQTWHDISVLVDGPVAVDIARHIGDVWNSNRLRMAALRREQLPKAPRGGVVMPDPVRALNIPTGSEDLSIGREGIQLLRTLSAQKRRSVFRFSPRTLINEIETAYVETIQTAIDNIFIETQYFRSKIIADSLAHAASNNDRLNLVMVLPAAPEEIAFGNNIGLSERFGEHLQSKCLDMILEAFEERAVILSPVRPVASTSKDRDELQGSEIIYVHSKIMVVDESHAIVGSANLNGRSLRWDTETALLCTDVSSVRRFRKAVMKHWQPKLSIDAIFEPRGMAATWRRLATDNSQCSPETRKGLLVFHELHPAKDIGHPVPGIPDSLV